MKNKIKTMLVIVIGLSMVGMLILAFLPSKQEENNVDLMDVKITGMLKYASVDLNQSAYLLESSITDEVMVKFATNFMKLNEDYAVTSTDDATQNIANVSDVKEVAKYIFDKEINFNNVSYKVENEKIYVPISYISTDAQIYKHRETQYNDGTYIAYIDCLEPSIDMYSQLSEANVTEYSQDDVSYTMVFKYKIKENRKVLLAFDIVNN